MGFRALIHAEASFDRAVSVTPRLEAVCEVRQDERQTVAALVLVRLHSTGEAEAHVVQAMPGEISCSQCMSVVPSSRTQCALPPALSLSLVPALALALSPAPETEQPRLR
jgi:hypothetical protein